MACCNVSKGFGSKAFAVYGQVTCFQFKPKFTLKNVLNVSFHHIQKTRWFRFHMGGRQLVYVFHSGSCERRKHLSIVTDNAPPWQSKTPTVLFATIGQ